MNIDWWPLLPPVAHTSSVEVKQWICIVTRHTSRCDDMSFINGDMWYAAVKCFLLANSASKAGEVSFMGHEMLGCILDWFWVEMCRKCTSNCSGSSGLSSLITTVFIPIFWTPRHHYFPWQEQGYASKHVPESLIDAWVEIPPAKCTQVEANVAVVLPVLVPDINLESWPASKARAAWSWISWCTMWLLLSRRTLRQALKMSACWPADREFIHTRLEIEGNTVRNSSLEIVDWCFLDWLYYSLDPRAPWVYLIAHLRCIRASWSHAE